MRIPQLRMARVKGRIRLPMKSIGIPTLVLVPVLLATAAGCTWQPASEEPFPQVDVAAYGERARALLEGRLEAAQAQPADAEVLGRAAMALHAYEIRDAAIDLYRQASARSRNDFRWHYLGGLVAGDVGRTAEAEAALRAAARLATEEPFVQLRLATAVLEAGRPAEALEMYEQVAAREPDSMASHFGRGSALASLGRFEEAVAALERAASLAGDYRPLYYQLALALRGAGRENEAGRFLALYERMQPDRRPPFLDPLLRQVEELREGSYLHHLNRGMGFEAAGRLEEALREYSRATDLEPAQVHARVNLISVYSQLGRHAEATQTYRRTLELNSGIEEAHYNYGVMLSRLGNHSEAEAAYRKALEVNPYLADARLNLGDTLERRGRPEAASEQFRRVLRVNPGHRLAHFRLGTLLYRQNRFSEALGHLRRMTDVKDGETPKFLMVLARAERALGNHTAAARNVAEARRIARRYNRADILAVLKREFPLRE